MSATNKEMRYDAFISYRHSELDKFVAEELHRQMESFKVPGSVAKKCKKKKINRIFRDKDELPITSNLADPIMNALRESEFLIVICSPRLKESIWCKREIENFIEMHGQEKILAVLVEGEPSESFPEELLYREKSVVNANGETTVVREPVEPLAADVRGKNKKEVKKLIKTEMLRLLASMLQCNYDDLKQRHRERKMHRMLALAAVVCVVGLTFGTVSTVMALKIQNQKEQIDKQYREALENNARMGADNSVELLQEGDRIGAITMARELLPDDLENQGIPYTAEAYFALTESVYPYAAGDVLRPIFQIKENAEIKEIKLSNDWNKIYVLTKYDKLTVWDIPNQKKCLELDLNMLGDSVWYIGGIDFLGTESIAILADEEVLIADFVNNTENEIDRIIYGSEWGYTRGLFSDQQGKYICVEYNDFINVYNAESGETISSFSAPENLNVIENKSFFHNENTLVLVYGSYSYFDENENYVIQIVNVETEEIINEFELPHGQLAQIDSSGNLLFAAINGDSKEITSLFDVVDDAEIYCFDILSGKKLWQYHVEERFINHIIVPGPEYDCFLFESYAQIGALDARTGKEIAQFSFGGDIVNIFPLETPDSYIVYTRDGERISLLPKKNMCVQVAGTFIPASDNIKQVEWGNQFVVSLPYFSKEVIVYDWYVDEGAKPSLQFENSVTKFTVSDNEKYSAIEFIDHKLMVIDNDTKEIIGQVTCDGYNQSVQFLEDDKIQRIGGDEVYIYDLRCNLIEQYKLNDESLCMVEDVSKDGKYVFTDTYDELWVIDSATTEIEGKLSKQECEFNQECTYYFSNKGDMCVIMDRANAQCRSYDVGEGVLLRTIDINATYIKNVQFSEDDTYVYFVYEDGKVDQYVSATMDLKCEINDLHSVTEFIDEINVDGETTYYFYNAEGAYVLREYEGQLKVEQSVPNLKAVMYSKNEYWVVDYDSLIVFPIYTYEEMLGKADRICYDNSLWNNN